jgi:hypothetical protein
MVQLLCKTLYRFLRLYKIEPAYDPVIPFVDLYPKELKAGSDSTHVHGTIMTAANRHNQPTCPSVHKH